jgi:hypothetical protein
MLREKGVAKHPSHSNLHLLEAAKFLKTVLCASDVQ